MLMGKKISPRDKRKGGSVSSTSRAKGKKQIQIEKKTSPKKKGQAKIDKMLQRPSKNTNSRNSTYKKEDIESILSTPTEDNNEIATLGEDYLQKFSSSKHLVQKLNKLQKILVATSQDERPDGIDETAAVLVSPGFLQHQEKEIRLGVCCCLVEILRIYAPEAPYVPEQLKVVFSTTITQLQSLRNTTSDPRYLHLLESLATVKSSIILVELSQQAVPGAEELLVDLYDCLLTAIRKDHPSEVQNWALDVLSSCLEELDVVYQPLLDTVLTCLLPANKADNIASYQIAQMLLKRSLEKVQQPISQFLNGVVVGGGVASGEVIRSELCEHAYPLIYELHKVDSSLLLYTLPNVAVQLKAEEVEVRSQAVALLGRLFASSHAEYGMDYRNNFRDFLGRFKDVDQSIRAQMLTIGSVILRKKPILRDDVQEAMVLRLLDPDAEIRLQAVREICDIAASCIAAVSETTLHKLGDRLMDKKSNIRKDTMTGLANIFAANISKKWADSYADNKEIEEDEEMDRKLGWIPGHVAKCYAYTHMEMKDRVILLWDEVIVPKSAPAEVKAAGLAYLFSKLDDTERNSLKHIVSDRARVREELYKYLEVRTALRKAGADAGFDLHAKVDSAMEALLGAHPTADGSNTLLKRLNDIKDQKVFKFLGQIASPSETTKSQLQAREELVARVGRQTPLGDYVKTLCRRCSLGIFGRDNLVSLLELAAEVDGKDQSDILQLATLLAEAVPNAFAGLSKYMEILYENTKTQIDVCETVLNLLAVIGVRAYEGSEKSDGLVSPLRSPPRSPPGRSPRMKSDKAYGFAKKLYEQALGIGTPRQASLAVEAMGALLPQDNRLLDRLAQELASSEQLDLENPHLHGVLEAAASLACVRPISFQPFASDFRTFVTDEILENKDLSLSSKSRSKKKKKRSAISAECAVMTSSIKVLVASLLPLPNLGTLEEVREEDEFKLEASGHALLEMLFGILENEGEPPSGKTMAPKDLTELRLAAAVGILRMSTNQYLQRLLNPNWWHALAWTAHDPVPSVRHSFMHELCSFVRQSQVPLRFMSYLSLCANEASEVKKEAHNSFLFAINMRRKALASSQAKMHENSFEAQDEDGVDMRFKSAMPEYVVPYLIHLLAHHPDFPKSPNDTNNVRKHERYLSFILEPLVQSLGSDADNLAFLLQIVNTIQANYLDAMMPSDTKIHRVAHLARNILRNLIKTQENLKEYPGTIYLPAPLFQRRPIETGSQTLQKQTSTPKSKEKSQQGELKTPKVPTTEHSALFSKSPSLGAGSPEKTAQSMNGDVGGIDTPNWGSPVTFDTSKQPSLNMESMEMTNGVESPKDSQSSDKRSSRQSKRRASKMDGSNTMRSPSRRSKRKSNTVDLPKESPAKKAKTSEKAKQSNKGDESVPKSPKKGSAKNSRSASPVEKSGSKRSKRKPAAFDGTSDSPSKSSSQTDGKLSSTVVTGKKSNKTSSESKNKLHSQDITIVTPTRRSSRNSLTSNTPVDHPKDSPAKRAQTYKNAKKSNQGDKSILKSPKKGGTKNSGSASPMGKSGSKRSNKKSDPLAASDGTLDSATKTSSQKDRKPSSTEITSKKSNKTSSESKTTLQSQDITTAAPSRRSSRISLGSNTPPSKSPIKGGKKGKRKSSATDVASVTPKKNLKNMTNTNAIPTGTRTRNSMSSDSTPVKSPIKEGKKGKGKKSNDNTETGDGNLLQQSPRRSMRTTKKSDDAQIEQKSSRKSTRSSRKSDSSKNLATLPKATPKSSSSSQKKKMSAPSKTPMSKKKETAVLVHSDEDSENEDLFGDLKILHKQRKQTRGLR